MVLEQKQKLFLKWHAKRTKNPRVSNVSCEGWVILSQPSEGPCQRRLSEFPPVLQLCFGALAECSQDVHNLVTVLAACRVRTLSLQGVPPSSRQMGLEVGRIRQRISLATVRANQMVILARLGMVGEGSAMAGRRRSWQRSEEQRMRMEREADWLAATTGQQLIQRGRFWGR